MWSNVADRCNLFRDCPKLTSYWHEIHERLETVLQNTITFDALTICTIWILNAEYSFYNRPTLNENITYWRGKTFESRCSNILKTGPWNVRSGGTTFSMKTQSEKLKGMWSKCIRNMISWRRELLELKFPSPLDCWGDRVKSRFIVLIIWSNVQSYLR